jgi:ubiquinol oxidase
MNDTKIDLLKEQEASIKRPRYKYSLAAKFFFASMDMVTGSKTTLAKMKLIEMLASIPYRAWEVRQYIRMTKSYRDRALVEGAGRIMDWSRDAQDNEYWHLLVINEKMKERGRKDPWFLKWPTPQLMIFTYVVITRVMAKISIKSAFLFNAEFEDHAEHVYAEYVDDNHLKLETEKVDNPLVKQYGDFDNWADVFRRIGLDEREHMNHSFELCGKKDCVVK